MKDQMTMRIIQASTLLACVLAIGLVNAQTAATPAAAASAPTAPGVRANLSAPLLDAQNLIKENKFAAAKEKLQIAQAVADKTPYESYIIDRLALSIAIGEEDAAGATKLLEQILQLDKAGAWLKGDESLRLMQAVGIVHYRAKDYTKAAAWMDRNIQAGGTEQAVKDVRIQSLLLAGNLARGSDLIDEEIALDEKAKKTPSQAHLTMLAQARTNLKDTAASTRALEKLVQYYPTKEHWRSLINRLLNRSDLSIRLQLDTLRLAFFTRALEDAVDYTDYIELAQKAGYSAEGLSAYERGAAEGLLGNTDAHKKLRTKLAHEVEQDRKTLAADTISALKKPDGFALFNLGFNQVGMQQFDKGLELMEKGVAKGIPKHPEDARLHLAVAYAQAGQNDKALQTFATVSGPEGLDDLVRYWTWAVRKP
jgi:tetratricopeptide (TPR) repeat protein